MSSKRRRFSHLHFFASNAPHSGMGEGMDSIARIFNAILGDIADEDKCAHIALQGSGRDLGCWGKKMSGAGGW